MNDCKIDFKRKKSLVTKVKDAGTNQVLYYTQTVNNSSYQTYDGSSESHYQDWSPAAVSALLDSTKDTYLYGDATKKHKLTVFYLERGTRNSNCRIAFNFQIPDIVTVKNELDTSDVNPALLEATQAVAESEAVGFEIQSAGGGSPITSPDVGKTIGGFTTNPNKTGTCHITFDVGTGKGSISGMRVKQGSTVALPFTGPNLIPSSGQYIKGWKIKGATGDNAPLYNIITAPYASTLELVAIWGGTTASSSVEEPKKPSLVKSVDFEDDLDGTI